MKVDREMLEDKLLIHLLDSSFHADYTNNMNKLKKIIGDYVGIVKITDIVNQNMPIHYLHVHEIFHLTRALYELLNVNALNPINYFTEEEIKNYMAITIEKIKKRNVIVLNNVDQVDEDTWLCSSRSYVDINDDYNNGLYTYNFRTQRESMKKIREGKTIESINVKVKKINQIVDSMLTKKYKINAIKWNVRKENGQESIHYNPDKRQLTIKKDEFTNIDIIDGMHRTGAAIKTAQIDPSIDKGLSIYVYYVDEITAGEIVEQEAKATPPDIHWTNTLDTKDKNMQMAKDLNKMDGRLFNKLTIENREVRYGDKFTTFDILSKAIEYYYDLSKKTYPEIKRIKEYLVEFFNLTIDIVKDKENALNKFCFIGYIALSKSLLDSENLLSDLEETLNGINYSQIDMNSNRISKKFIESIAKYFVRGDE
jgi:hypothetical protein